MRATRRERYSPSSGYKAHCWDGIGSEFLQWGLPEAWKSDKDVLEGVIFAKNRSRTFPIPGMQGLYRPSNAMEFELCNPSNDVPCASTRDSCSAANMSSCRAKIPFIPSGLERGLRGYRECREGSRGSDAGPCPRHALAGGLVRLR